VSTPRTGGCQAARAFFEIRIEAMIGYANKCFRNPKCGKLPNHTTKPAGEERRTGSLAGRPAPPPKKSEMVNVKPPTSNSLSCRLRVLAPFGSIEADGSLDGRFHHFRHFNVAECVGLLRLSRNCAMRRIFAGEPSGGRFRW